jgi:translation initiation factor 3 subunit G
MLEQSTGPSSTPSTAPGKPGLYRPPAMNRRTEGDSMDSRYGSRSLSREEATVRVTNLSEDTKESDLAELFGRFGSTTRIFLARDRNTNLSKGFAFISFAHREDAAKAIEKLSGYGYDHLILQVEWARDGQTRQK